MSRTLGGILAAFADHRVLVLGDVMLDALRFMMEVAERRSNVLARLALRPGQYGVATIHRAGNTDDAERLCGPHLVFEFAAPFQVHTCRQLHPLGHDARRQLGVWATGTSATR